MTLFFPTPNPVKLELPLFSDKVPAGFPSPAADYVSSRIDLNEYCISHPNATYFLYATGDSMLEAGITEGSMLVVDRSIAPAHGDIVIASIAGEFTVKRLCLHPRAQLEPMNAKYEPIVLQDDGDSLEVVGVVVSSITRLK
ncbi:translesion error-prone DNA polymerase V autoproteolytic subunit [Serratia rubidaea]|uniref:translesion error-prone DNA polymerase V autoproteolytic subunit n=1 Tax=Serratia rubidaea TaxID=61652 RepID=UPI00178197BD|nr:translesion error-prone DNA polymerase V autoproteolytic subunit [Serratia rubidaea]MBD8451706.1 translesion error-prone DNA polymerase V autoproteolytic subunit [Serratia rubidaea]MCR0998540.1 translesion error-prone DNA polymerase V autoproteolytic subunit [Serratia rubidaea]MDC6111205.1 translesion error-prone DNA polymerase V autoproteolytic subunit [Serratia rubidaea]UJD79957.1 translesion error-prone DNA polymerase V autoproteolytic subunit [Serratia rubidaea]UJD84513.1 translesion er